jgi:hypothetical protein
MRRADWLVAAVAVLAPIAMGSVSVVGDSSLVWYANPLAWPALHVLPSLALLPLLAPVMIRPPVQA